MSFRCRICGETLEERSSQGGCVYCGTEEATAWSCPQGHLICEVCRTAKPAYVIEQACLHSRDVDPFALAERIMRHPAFLAYGEEHHLLVAPVLLAVLRNRGIPGATDAGIREAMARLVGIPMSVCGTRGDCGAAASAGTVLSLLRGATPLSDGTRTEAMQATAHTLLRIAALGGPRCCKQSVFETLHCAWDELRRFYDLEPLPRHTCGFAGKLHDCKAGRCPYFA